MNRSQTMSTPALSGLLAAFLIFTLLGQPVFAHWSGGYSHDADIYYYNPDWMSTLPDTNLISELSIPGTHDTMAKCGDDIPKCQTLILEKQLEAGIRMLDIRCRRIWNHFDITHGCWQNSDDCGNLLIEHYEFDDVLCRVVNFLDDHKKETVLMRVQDAGCPIDPHRSFEATYLDYVENKGCISNGQFVFFRDYIWKGDDGDYSSVPTLGEVRGKIVILDNFAAGKYGISWADKELVDIQDDYHFNSNWDLDDKWYKIRNHLLKAAYIGSMNKLYVNFLSGSGGSFPYFVASGHSSPGTGDPRLWTGELWDNVTGSTCGSTHCFEDFFGIFGYQPFFPRQNCCCWPWWIKTCSVYFEGTNEIAYRYILTNSNPLAPTRWGIIMADFPGPGLIDAIIRANFPGHWAASVSANGPYEGDEGSQITFEASPLGSGLQYSWSWFHCDIDDAGACIPGTEWSHTTDWSNDPSASYTWYDDWAGTATIEVTDGFVTHNVETQVFINNVAPMVDAGPDQTVNEGDIVSLAPATFSDKGTLDTHTATISWGDGTPLDIGVVSETPATVSGSHVYADNGSYTVTVCVTDDDGGTTCDDLAVIVNNVPPTADVDRIIDETGAVIGLDVPVGLVGLGMYVGGSFNDLGTLDSHTATFDWDDGSAPEAGLVAESPFGPPGDTAGMDGSVSGSHIYMTPGVYSILLTVTDDDGQPGTAGRVFEVATGMVALEKAIADLQELAGNPELDSEAAAKIQDAVDKLNGQKGGQARNGAIDLLKKRNLNATLEKIKQALQCLEAAEAADATLDLTYCKGFLTLIAKSVAVEAVAQAEAAISKPSDTEKVELAMQLLVQGDGSLTAMDHVGAVAFYQEAVRAARR